MTTTTNGLPRYPAWQVIVTLIVGPLGIGVIGSGLAAVVVAAVVATADGGAFDVASVTDATMSLPAVATSLFVTALGFVLGPALLAALTKRPVARTLGLSPAPHPAVLLLAPLGTLALGPTSDRIVALAQQYIPDWTVGALGQIDGIVRANPMWAVVPLLALLPGFGEEILFRGFIQRSIGRGTVAIVVSALSFAAIHLDPHHVLGVVPLGLYFAWIADRTYSTWPTIVAHTVNNAAAVFAAKSLGSSTVVAEHASLGLVVAGWVVCGTAMVLIARLTPRESAAVNASEIGADVGVSSRGVDATTSSTEQLPPRSTPESDR